MTGSEKLQYFHGVCAEMCVIIWLYDSKKHFCMYFFQDWDVPYHSMIFISIYCHRSIRLLAAWPRNSGLIPDRDKRYVSLLQSPHQLSGLQPRVQWVLGAVSPEVKQLGHKADLSSPSSVRIKNDWSYTSPPLCTLMACTETTFTAWESVFSSLGYNLWLLKML